MQVRHRCTTRTLDEASHIHFKSHVRSDFDKPGQTPGRLSWSRSHFPCNVSSICLDRHHDDSRGVDQIPRGPRRLPLSSSRQTILGRGTRDTHHHQVVHRERNAPWKSRGCTIGFAVQMAWCTVKKWSQRDHAPPPGGA